MTLPNEEVIDVLRDQFVVGWHNIKKEEFVGNSHGYRKNQTAVGTTNGAGGRNVQLFVLASDLTVLHVLPGFWQADDLLAELRFAKQLHRLWADGDVSHEQKLRMARTIRRSHVRGFSARTIARSSWQSFDEHREMARYKTEPRDTITLDNRGHPRIKPMCQLVHERMEPRLFTSFKDFDTEQFVDYGRPYYDNNRHFDKGREFAAAKRANAKRQKRKAREQRAIERNSK